MMVAPGKIRGAIPALLGGSPLFNRKSIVLPSRQFNFPFFYNLVLCKAESGDCVPIIMHLWHLRMPLALMHAI